ncbi:MAG: hypothetical protein JRJ45_10560 [Deltaproteobacteria bacterium]|nr:hypothetical protein [Deltaproteobacteria bacterium]
MIKAHHNIEHLNRVVLELFIRLYDSFPHPLNIDRQTTIAIGFGLISDDATDMKALSTGAIADDVMEWLKEEGFNRYNSDPNYPTHQNSIEMD